MAYPPRDHHEELSSVFPDYDVFISHAGEDKATIAIPLREKLLHHGITAFVDESDMPAGTDAERAMMHAMKTAKVAVVVMSPEFVARKWPMKELLCFLRRRDHAEDGLTIIPFFYRLRVSDLYQEPRFDRLDRDGNPLYHESRFFQRMKNHEPEADTDIIKDALQKIHGIMGLKNTLEATNDSAYLMSQRRELLLQQLSRNVMQVLHIDAKQPEGSSQHRNENTMRREGVDAFYPYFHLERDTSKLVLTFFEEGTSFADSTEGKILQLVTARSDPSKNALALYGIGGVGKTTVLRKLSTLEAVKKRFRDGVYFLSLGADATERNLIEALSEAVQKSGGIEAAQEMRSEKHLRNVVNLFSSWFAEKQCLFMVDDVWETPKATSSLIHDLLTLHISGRKSKVLMTTRNLDIASRAEITVAMKPYKPLDPRSYAILLRYCAVKMNKNDNAVRNSVIKILEICCGLPLFLAVAGKAVRTLSLRSGIEGGTAYHIYASTLSAHTQSLLDTDVGSYARLQTTLRVSVDLLEERMRNLEYKIRLTAAEMLRRLSVLEKQEKVPMSMLRHLWEFANETEASIVAREFEQVGLTDMEIEQNEGGSREMLRMHDSLHHFAARETRRHREDKNGHEAVVRGYGAGLEMKESCRAWWSPELKPDGYVHQHLCRHLLSCDQEKEVIELLFCPQWAARVVEVCGVASLEQDFTACISVLRNGTEPSKGDPSVVGSSCELYSGPASETVRALALIAEAVKLSSTFIARNEREISFQMYGRLKRYATKITMIREYLDRIEQESPRPWLQITNCFLKEPGGSNIRIVLTGAPVLCMKPIDLERFACGCEDGSIAIVNVGRYEVERRWAAHVSGVHDITISEDRKVLISRSFWTFHTVIKMWNTETYAELCPTLFTAESLDWFHEMEKYRIYSLTKADQKCVIDQDIGSEHSVIAAESLQDHLRQGASMVFMPGGEQVVTAGICHDLRLWNLTKHTQMVLTFVDHPITIRCLAVTEDGRFIFSGEAGGIVRRWDAVSLMQIGGPFERHAGVIDSIGVSSDGKWVVCGTFDLQICMWDATTGKKVRIALDYPGGRFTGVCFLRRNDVIVTCSRDGTVRLWDLQRTKDDRHVHRPVTGTRWSFTPDGKLVISASLDGTLRIWDTISKKQLWEATATPTSKYDVMDIIVTKDGQKFLTISRSAGEPLDPLYPVSVWSIESRKALCTRMIEIFVPAITVISARGDFMVTSDRYGCVKMWDLTGADKDDIIYTCPIVLDGVHPLIYLTDDEKRVVHGHLNGRVLVWDCMTRQTVKQVTVELSELLSVPRKRLMEFVDETCETNVVYAGPSVTFCGNETRSDFNDYYCDAWIRYSGYAVSYLRDQIRFEMKDEDFFTAVDIAGFPPDRSTVWEGLEGACQKEMGLRLSPGRREINYGEGEDEVTLATMETAILIFDFLPEERIVFAALEGGQTAFMRLRL